MTFFDFVNAHPWWTLIYIVAIGGAVGGIFRIVINIKHKD